MESTRSSDVNSLHQALKQFDSNGKYAKHGPWEIAKGGYDLDFEISYKGAPVIQCVAGEVFMLPTYSTDFDILDNIAFMQVIAHDYPDVSIYTKYVYDIYYTANDVQGVLVGDSGDTLFDTEDEAFQDADFYILSIIESDYPDSTPDNFAVEVYPVYTKR